MQLLKEPTLPFIGAGKLSYFNGQCQYKLHSFHEKHLGEDRAYHNLSPISFISTYFSQGLDQSSGHLGNTQYPVKPLDWDTGGYNLYSQSLQEVSPGMVDDDS